MALPCLLPAQTSAIVTSRVDFINITQLASPGYVILENATVNNVGNGSLGPQFDIHFGAAPARFKQQFASPVNLSSKDQMSWVVTNHENRTVNVVIVFQVQPNLSDYTGSMAYQMVVPPLATVRYLINYFTPDPIQWYLKAYPRPYDTPYEQINPGSAFNRSAIYAWRFSMIDTAPAWVTIADFSTLTLRRDLNGMADEFFQYSYREWPGKVHSVADLIAAKDLETIDLATHPGHGGLDGSSFLPNQGPSDHWRILPVNGKYYFVHPGGKPFWSFGIQGMHDDMSTWIDGRTNLFQYLPPQNGPDADCYGTATRFFAGSPGQITTLKAVKYNLKRKYGEFYQQAWLDRARTRIRSWGFNTIAPFCLNTLYDDSMPYCLQLDTFDYPIRLTTAPSLHWMTMPDPFGSDFESWMTDKFSSELQIHNGRINFMGVFVDNEQSWGHTQDSNLNNRFSLAIGSLNAPYTQPAKQALMTMLTVKYQSVSLLNRAWGTSFTSWAAMRGPISMDANTMTKGMRSDIAEFTRRYASTYFMKVRRALTASGMNDLYLGCRFWNYTPEVVGAAKNYVDAISFNNYTQTAGYPWAYLASLQKPVIISEWSNPINQRGSIGWNQSTIQQNHDEIVNFFTTALRQPYIIGAHWYETYDSPISGISNSNWNVGFGILDDTDQPKQEVVDALRYIGQQLYEIRNP